MIYSLYKYSLFIYSVYQLINEQNESKIEKLAENVKKNAIMCGPLAVKLIQFMIMRNYLSKTTTLDFVLENCMEHSFEETKKMYLEDYGRSINYDYIIDSTKPIGSGSIGQVYKVFSIKEDDYIALKVKHPGIDIQVTEFIQVIKLILRMLSVINSVSLLQHIIVQYIDNIYTQIDYTEEAKNTMKLKRCFKNEKRIIIPEVYNFTSNFIAMSYHEGQSYSSITDKRIKTLSSFYINVFGMASVLVHDMLHGDLHHGNWKVQVHNDNEIKIVIYDCGLVYSSGDLEYNKKLMEYIFMANYEELLYVVNDKKDHHLIKECMKSINSKNPKNAYERLNIFLNEAIKYKLMKDRRCINVLNAYAIIGSTMSVSVNTLTKYIYQHPNNKNSVMLFTYLGILEKMEIFTDLQTFIANWLDEDSFNIEIYNKWLMKTFGHTKGHVINDILYNKINLKIENNVN